MNEPSKQTIIYLNIIRKLKPNLYKKMIAKKGISDEMVIQNEIDIPEEKREVYRANVNKKRDSKWENIIYRGGKPYVDVSLPEKEKPSSSMEQAKVKGSKQKRNTQKTIRLYIDAENISAKYAEKIMNKSNEMGKIVEAKAYRRENDKHTKGWGRKGEKYGIKSILVPGGPDKDKIDKKIIRDIQSILPGKSDNIICLVTSDGGYVNIVNKVKNLGREIIVIGDEKASSDLQEAADKFISL